MVSQRVQKWQLFIYDVNFRMSIDFAKMQQNALRLSTTLRSRADHFTCCYHHVRWLQTTSSVMFQRRRPYFDKKLYEFEGYDEKKLFPSFHVKVGNCEI